MIERAPILNLNPTWRPYDVEKGALMPQRDADHKYYPKTIYVWGNEKCPHLLTQIMDGKEARKHECNACWQTLLKEAGESDDTAK